MATEQRELECILGFSGTTWTILNNTTHKPINVLSVTTGSYSATLNYDFTATKVINFNVTSDETFAKKGIVGGASVGLTSAVIQWGQPAQEITGKVYYNGTSWVVYNQTGNLALHSFNTTTGVLKLTHDECTEYSFSAIPHDGCPLVQVSLLAGGATSIVFKDQNMNTITTPNTNMSFYFHRRTNGCGVKNIPTAYLSTFPGQFFVRGLFEVEV